MKTEAVALGFIILLGVFLTAGCVGGQPTQNETVGTSEEEQESGGEQVIEVGWCQPGSEWSFTQSPVKEGEGKYQVMGQVEHMEKQMCKIVTNVEMGEKEVKLNYYFTRDRSKVCYRTINNETGVVLYSGCLME